MINSARPSAISSMDFLFKHRFFILTWTVFVMVLAVTWKGYFVGDFWQHSAVIRELSTNILNPKHPQLPLEITHAFYSPYAIMLAIFARILHIDSIQILSIMTVVNYWLFIWGLRVFTKSIYPEKYQSIVFYFYLLVLCWWGWRPYHYSSFYHLESLTSVLSYPSAFSMVLTLFALGIYNNIKQYSNIIYIALLSVMSAFVLISHPPTFIFLAVMLFVNSLENNTISIKALIHCSIILGVAALLAICWPYFSILDLIIKEGAVYHLDNQYMYWYVFSKTWPLLLGVYLIIFQKRDEWHNRFLLALIILTGVYLFGYVFEKYTYGRILSFIAILLQLIIAIKMVNWEEVGIKYRSKLLVPQKFLCIGVVIICLILSVYPLAKIAYVVIKKNSTYSEYIFLNKYVDQYDVVLSDLFSSWRTTTFGGKVVTVAHPLAFVKDQGERISDVNHFFTKNTDKQDRLGIIEKYGVNFILLRKNDTQDWRAIEKSLRPYAKVVFDSNVFLLLSVLNVPE